MAEPHAHRRVEYTPEFRRWMGGLAADHRAEVQGAIQYLAESGPTLGRPRVDVIHGTRVGKLKEARVDRGTRLLFAFDSNRNVVMLVGGDKTGKWNRWYPPKIQLAERLYLNHERSIGKESQCLNQRAARRAPAQADR